MKNWQSHTLRMGWQSYLEMTVTHVWWLWQWKLKSHLFKYTCVNGEILPGDDGDNEVAPHEAEDEGAGEEEVEDGDPHPAKDHHDDNDDDNDDDDEYDDDNDDDKLLGW